MVSPDELNSGPADDVTPDEAGDHPAHSAPGVAVDHGEQPGRHEGEPGRHTETAASLTVAELASRVASPDAERPTGQTTSDEPHPNRWITLVAVCLGTFMLLLDITIVNVALPDIQNSLHSSFSGLQWVVDVYALTLAALLLTTGSLADMYGRRKLYVIGLVLFTLASLACGLAPNTLTLQIARGVQGVGGAITFSVSLALLANAFRGKDRGVAFGVWGAITGLAVAVGPLLGGALTSGLSWRWIFFVNLPIGVAAVLLCVTRVEESRAPHSRRPDWVGFALFTVGLAALVYGLIESGRRSFSSGVVIGSLVIAGVLLVGFIVAEAVVRTPMFELSLFRKPTFSGGAVAAFGISASIFSLLLYLTLYIQDVLGYSPFQTGLRLVLLSGGILLTSTIAGRLTAHVPIRLLIGPGLVIIGVGLLLMRGLDGGSSWTHLIPGLLVSGVGVGIVNPPLASTAIGVVTPERAGMASGINSTFRQVGIATGIALLGTLFTSRIGDQVRQLVAGTSLSGKGAQLADAIQSGAVSKLLAGTKSPTAQYQIEHVAASAFANGLDHILLVAAILVLACGVVSFLTIRTKDMVHANG